MIGLLIVLLAAAAVCGRLGAWQLDRAQQRAEQSARHAAQDADAAGPRGLGTVLPAQSAFRGELVGRTVWVAGEYEAGQLLVVNREWQGRRGFLVLTPLRVTDDGSGGSSWAHLSGPPVLAVVRGWVADADDAAVDAAALAVPAGPVRLTGYLQASEAAGPGGLPAGRTDSIATGALVNAWGGPAYSGYLVLASAVPAQPTADAGGPALLSRPQLPGGTGLNLQNAFYALQWWLFGGFALALWLRSVRDEARGVRRDGILRSSEETSLLVR